MFDRIVGSIGTFSYRNRKLISIVALALFVAVIVTSSQLVIEYSYAEESIITDVFPQDDTIVIVYESKDEAKIEEIIQYLQNDAHVTSVQAYANTLGMKMSAEELSSMMGIPQAFVNTLFYIHQNGMDTSGMTLVDFVTFISSDDFLNNELFSSMIDDETKGQIAQMKTLVDALASEEEYTADEIAGMLGVEKRLVQSIFLISQMKDASLGSFTPIFWVNVANILGMDEETIDRIFDVQPVKALQFAEFVDVINEVAQYTGSLMDEEQVEQLGMLKDMSDMVEEGKSGFLSHDMSVESYVKALEQVLTMTPQEMEAMKCVCRESAKRYSIEECAKQYEELFAK